MYLSLSSPLPLSHYNRTKWQFLTLTLLCFSAIAANLPAKVVGPDSLLTRTGVYFGFARVLAQDPDDPSLTDSEDVDASSSADGRGGAGGIDDEDNEVVLGASPIGDVGEGFMDSNLPRPRQNSKGQQPSPASVLASRPDKEADVSRSELSNGGREGGLNGATASSSSTSSGRRRKTKRVKLRQEDSQVFRWS